MKKTFLKALKLAWLQAPLLMVGFLVAVVTFAAQAMPDVLGLIDGSGVFVPPYGPQTDSSGTYDPVSKCSIAGLKGHEVMGVMAVTSFFAARRMFIAGAQNGASRTAMALGAVVAMAFATAACVLLIAGTTAALRQYGLEHGEIMVMAEGSGYHISMTARKLMSPHMAIPEATMVAFGLVSAQTAAGIAALISLGDSRHMRMLAVIAAAALVTLTALSLCGIKIDPPLFYFYYSSPALTLVFLEVALVHIRSFKF